MEIDYLLTTMTRIYNTQGYKVTRGDFERAPSRKGLRYTATCQGCGCPLSFEIVMGQVEPRGINNAIGMEQCV